MRYKIDAKLFNAVNACAGTNDVRYYLNTFFIDAEKNQIVGTNGHIMAIAPITLEPGQAEPELVASQQADEPHQVPRNGQTHGWLFSAFPKPVAKSADVVYIDTHTCRAILHGDKLRGVDSFDLTPVEGAFPDYAIVEAKNGEGEPIPAIGFNPEYLARIGRWAHLDFPRCQLVFKSEIDAIQVRFRDLPDLRVTLMPCRF